MARRTSGVAAEDTAVRRAIDHIDSLSGYARLVQAGVFSDHFWLSDVRDAFLSI